MGEKQSLSAVSGLSPDAVLKFWQEYLLQTRKEIDLEKTEGTKILHMKILLIGALFLLVKGTLGLVAIALLPIAMLALDRMQLTRLEYIIHRWQYLDASVRPELQRLLGQNAQFFEQLVMQRHGSGYYFPVEAMIRRLLFVPAMCAATIAAGAAIVLFANGPEGVAYAAGIGWLGLLVIPAVHNPHLYGRKWVFVTASLVAAALLVDWLLVPGFNIVRVIQDVLKGA